MLRSLVLISLLALSSCVLSACDSDALPAPSVSPPLIPANPDGSYTTMGLREWALIGNEVDTGNDILALEVMAISGTDYVDVWLDGGPGQRLEKSDAGSFTIDLDVSALGPGEYQVLLAADGNDTAFMAHTFKRSHPLYVVVTTDWDDADTSDEALALQDALHAEHPELLLTHFVGPYTFTDPNVTEARRDILVEWLLSMRTEHADEIGLHIHPYCNFVEQVGTILGINEIECNTDESTVYSSDSTGYTVRVSSYDDDEFTNLLRAADAIFQERGLGKPTSFRAGGWTAELNTMRSLEAAGYVADTSANNWARMEEWDGPFMGTLYDWNKEHWSSIGDTSQPYYPSTEDILVTGTQTIGVLEVPDNGILVDYVEIAEMVEIFEANWDGELLATPVNYSIGFHPSNFNATYKLRMTKALDHVDQFLAVNDAGPVIYGRLSDMAKIWKQ